LMSTNLYILNKDNESTTRQLTIGRRLQTWHYGRISYGTWCLNGMLLITPLCWNTNMNYFRWVNWKLLRSHIATLREPTWKPIGKN
jgi:hypothetical protein